MIRAIIPFFGNCSQVPAVPQPMKNNIKLSLFRLTPVKLLALLSNVQAKMAEHVALFPTPPVPPADLLTLRTKLEDSIEAATNGSQAAKAARDACVEEVRDVLRETADYVRMVAKGDKVILTNSGFELAKQGQPSGPVGVPHLVAALMTGVSGQVLLRWLSAHARKVYNVYMTADDPATPGARWEKVGVTTKTRLLVEDLEPYKPYWFSVSATGISGEGAKCDPIIGRAA